MPPTNNPPQIVSNSTIKMMLFCGMLMLVAIYAKPILVPIIFSALFSLLLYPFCEKLERVGFSRSISIILPLVGVATLALLLLSFISIQLEDFINTILNSKNEIQKSVSGIIKSLESVFKLPATQTEGWLKRNFYDSGTSYIDDFVTTTSGTLVTFGLVPVYAFFMLYYKDNVRLFLIKATHIKAENTYSTFNQIKDITKNYIIGLSTVISVVAVLNCFGLLVLGIDYAIFLGIVSAVLTIIPYIGVIAGACLPIAMAMVTKDSYWYAIGVAALYAAIQFLEGNFITPKIVGDRVNVNPLAAIIALIVGGYIWGIPGMIIAIPIVAIIKSLVEKNDALKHFALLLTHEKPKANE